MIVWIRDDHGVWHGATATYPNEAETVCERRVKATHFQTEPPNTKSTGEFRPNLCSCTEQRGYNVYRTGLNESEH